MKKLFLAVITSFLFAHIGLSDTYVWEDYDDFSGSSLDSSKWEAGYFSGGQATTVSGGVATLSGSGYTGSDVENVPSIWQDAASQSTGQSNSGLFVTSTEIYGIEVEVSIPQSGNSQNVGFIVETYPADGSTYNGIELAWRENGLNWFYENENPSTAQILELSQEADFDTTYTLSVIHTGSRMELHINGTRVANLNSNFTPNHWLIGSFNDDGKTFTVPIDNVRVLRRSTSDSLNGTTLFLDSDDPVTLTLAFENGTITSTFEDGGEDSGTETGIQYDYIIVDQNRFSITETPQLIGDYITFDKSSSRGKLFDFKSDGQIDESGTWEFSFTFEDFEGYAPDSLVGESLQITETDENNNTSQYDFFFTPAQAYYWDNSLGKLNKLRKVPYTYEKNSSTEASLLLSQDFGEVNHRISFSSHTMANSTWEDNGTSGVGNVEISTDVHAPVSLAGWNFKNYLGDNYLGDTYHFENETSAVLYHQESNASNSTLTRISYSWEPTGPSMGKLVINPGQEIWLFFDSSTTGYFDFDGLAENDAVQFGLFYYSDGNAHQSLAGNRLSLGDTIYIFTSEQSVTIHSADGKTSSEYAYLRNGSDEGVLSFGSSIMELDFYSSGYGRVEKGGSGYFRVLQNWATKGWVWYDHYPWAYSDNMQDWFYQILFINDENESDMAHYQVWDNQWNIPDELHYSGESNFSSADAYYWEDYDDFSGSELNSSKWDVGYWGGGQPVTISNGQAELSGAAFSSSSAVEMPSDLVAATQESTEGNTFLFFTDDDIYGIQADISLPAQGNAYEAGIYLASLDINPLGSLGAELRYETGGAVFLFDYFDLDTELEHSETGSLDTFHQLQITKIGGKTSYYLDNTLIKQFDSSSHDEDYWAIGAFNDYGLPYLTYADNIRVLRKKSYPQGWMWMDYYPWAYSHESDSWLYFQLVKDADGQPGMIYWDTATKDWDIYHPALSPEQSDDQEKLNQSLNQN